jgi:hypothetical protein
MFFSSPPFSPSPISSAEQQRFPVQHHSQCSSSIVSIHIQVSVLPQNFFFFIIDALTKEAV